MGRMGRFIWRHKWRLLAVLAMLAVIYIGGALGSIYWLQHAVQQELDVLESQGIPTKIASYREKLRAEDSGNDDASEAIAFLMDLWPDDFSLSADDTELAYLVSSGKFRIPAVFESADTDRGYFIDLYQRNAHLVDELQKFHGIRNPSPLMALNATFTETWEYLDLPERPDYGGMDLLLLCIAGGYLAANTSVIDETPKQFLLHAATLTRMLDAFPENLVWSGRVTLATLGLWRLQRGPLSDAEHQALVETNTRHPLATLGKASFRHIIFNTSEQLEFIDAHSLSPVELTQGLLPENIFLSWELLYSDALNARAYPRFVDSTAVTPDGAYQYVHRELEAMHQRNALLYRLWEETITIQLLDSMMRSGIHSITELRAREQAVLLLAAVRAYEADRGEFPASLEALVPDWIASLPRDPFTNADFAYEADATRARISWEVPPRLTRGSQSSTPMSFEIPAL